jgi:hypothetical protein
MKEISNEGKKLMYISKGTTNFPAALKVYKRANFVKSYCMK